MKVARTFTIDHALVLKLQKTKNQSKIVNHALYTWFDESYQTLAQTTDDQLKLALHLRVCGCFETLTCPTMVLLNRLTPSKEPSS